VRCLLLHLTLAWDIPENREIKNIAVSLIGETCGVFLLNEKSGGGPVAFENNDPEIFAFQSNNPI